MGCSMVFSLSKASPTSLNYLQPNVKQTALHPRTISQYHLQSPRFWYQTKVPLFLYAQLTMMASTIDRPNVIISKLNFFVRLPRMVRIRRHTVFLDIQEAFEKRVSDSPNVDCRPKCLFVIVRGLPPGVCAVGDQCLPESGNGSKMR